MSLSETPMVHDVRQIFFKILIPWFIFPRLKDDYPNSEQEDEEEEPLPLSLPPEDEGEEEDEVSGEMKEERMTPGGVVVMDEPQVRRLSTSLRLCFSVLSPS